MKQGDIALFSVRQANGQPKNRPVLLLKQMPPFNDWLVCGISSQLRQECKGFDYIILDTDLTYTATGLRGSSLIRLGFLDVIPQNAFPGSIGKVDETVLKLLLKRLANHLLS
ncbi:MAG TPA: type II toxin-antitoxin system PemK/MazF family toxin [Chitinophagaceae bacterium]|nr:type II toxin-antitoxin system PemK/MazF family toxin [Chitinophagaceae bacterium]